VKISCPSCSAKYSIADEKVQNRLAKIRCRKCGTSIVIDGNVSPAAVFAGEVEGEPPRAPGAQPGGFAPPAAAASAGTVYTVDFGENDQRQMGVADLVAAYNAGQVTGETYLWADGFADWTPLAQIDEIVAALNAAATGVDETSAAGASTAPSESPWADGAAARAQATPGPVAVAARGADLFGGIDRAGAEAEIATSASSGSSTIGSAGGGFGAGAPATTGARNESSVLFSLSALTAAAGTSRPNNLAPVVPTQHVTEDSGLIDLKALTAAAEHHRPMAAAPVAAAPLGLGGGLPLGGAPLGSPYGGLSSPSLPPQRAKSNTVLYIGIFAVVAVLGAVLIFRLTEKEAAPPLPPVPTPIAAPAPLPPPLPTAATLPTAEAKAPPTGDAESETSPAKSGSTTKKSTAKASSGASSSSSTSSSSSSSSTAAPPAKKKSSGGGGCGCAANDLMCNMRCSSK